MKTQAGDWVMFGLCPYKLGDHKKGGVITKRGRGRDREEEHVSKTTRSIFIKLEIWLFHGKI
jgi:hypothetical protein